jgi:iron complex transport system substrate-binding protein
MFRKSVLYAFVVLVFFSCSDNKKSNSGTVQRIISLAPNITEMIYALDEQDKLVAVTDYCVYPEAAKKKEKIGGFLNPNLEKMMASKPDLLIGLQSHSELAQKLNEQNLRTVLLPDNTVDEIFAAIDTLGQLLRAQGRAEKLIHSIRDSISTYRQQAEALPIDSVKGMLVLGREPGTTRNVGVIGSHNFMDSLWTELGCQNVFGNIPMKFSQINREAIITADPDLIIEFKSTWNQTPDANERNLLEWNAFNQVKAVKNKNIFIITGVYALIPGPRMYLLMKDYFQILKNYAQSKK